VATAQKEMMTITDDEFASLRDLVYDRFGINLTDRKRTLLVGRLQQVIRNHELDSFEAYHDRVTADESGTLLDELVNRVSTNFTYFWREPDHFEHLRDEVLPDLMDSLRAAGSYDLRLWCAAAATGEEPCVLAMMLREALAHDRSRWKAGLLATDISQRALDVARRGVYPDRALDKLPKALLGRYCRRTDTETWTVDPGLVADVTYRRFNLMNELPFKAPFHVIFCRNVMIYFDQPTRADLVRRMYDFVVPGGYLYVGHSESLGRVDCPFDYVRPGIYRRQEAG